MKQAIKELEYCIVRENMKIGNFESVIKMHTSTSQIKEREEKIIVCKSNIKEFQHAISVLNKSINEQRNI